MTIWFAEGCSVTFLLRIEVGVADGRTDL